jgi:hypothetical protein
MSSISAIAPATSYRIRADFYFYAGALHAPKSGYLMGPEDYDGRRVICAPLEFSRLEDAYNFLVGEPSRFFDGGLVCDPDGSFSAPGVYVTRHGEYSRPVYRIVSAKTGRSSKAILAAIAAERAVISAA